MNSANNVLLEFNPHLFWDTKISSINIDDHARYIIERVVTRGTLSDWQTLKKAYGLEKIKNTSIQIRSLDAKTLAFLSNYFDIGKEEFRCFKRNHRME